MSYILGIDTGGTYTDGVLIDPSKRIVHASGKAFTTREDLSIGIAACIHTLPREALMQTAMVCLSTTLATNSVVEGKSGSVGLFLMGRKVYRDIPAAFCVTLQGELDIKGRQRVGIDEGQVRREAEALRGKIDAVAISGFASVRNSVHEIAVKKIVREVLDVPVVCAHELSQTLGYYDRTVTAALNAGLIPCITSLVSAVERVLNQNGLGKLPIMIVKGDGSLMRRDYALDRPIETVLSGPAASVVGGQFLTGISDAIVLDMGGTTSDIAHISGGRVSLNEEGAVVGGWRTQLRAVNVSTYGIGGDSRLTLDRSGQLCVGPQRVVPLCVAGDSEPALVNELLEFLPETSRDLPSGQHTECCRALDCPKRVVLTDEEIRVLDLLGNRAHSIFWLEKQGISNAWARIDRLEQLGAVQRCGLTPTDILHAAGRLTKWNTDAANAGVRIMAARAGCSYEEFIRRAIAKTEYGLSASCLKTVLEEHDGINDSGIIADFLINKPESRTFALDFSINIPVIALGAPVKAWLPQVCKILNAPLEIPEYAEVANAVGAAVGSVSIECEALIRPDQYHEMFVIHAPWGVDRFPTLDEAQVAAEEKIEYYAECVARDAGGHDVQTTHTVRVVQTDCLGKEEKTFVEMRIRAVAIGAPAWSK